MPFKSTFRIRDGKFTGGNRPGLTEYIRRNDGKDVALEIKLSARRSTDANAFYWVWNEIVAEALRELGNAEMTAKKVHEISKLKCNPEEIVFESTGEVITLGGSTKMPKDDFGYYMERYKEFWEPYIGFELPEPNTQTQIELQ
jgi:hypothetical protein